MTDKVRIPVRRGTLAPYELGDESTARRHAALKEAIERLATEHQRSTSGLSRSEAILRAANEARAKLQVLSQFRKNAANTTAQGEQCVRALADEGWLRREYNLNQLDWNHRSCAGISGAQLERRATKMSRLQRASGSKR